MVIIRESSFCKSNYNVSNSKYSWAVFKMSKIQIRFFVSCYAYPMYRYLITKYVFLYPKLPCLQGFNTMNFFNKSASELDFWPWKKVSGLAIDMHNHFTSKTIGISLSKVLRYTKIRCCSYCNVWVICYIVLHQNCCLGNEAFQYLCVLIQNMKISSTHLSDSCSYWRVLCPDSWGYRSRCCQGWL